MNLKILVALVYQEYLNIIFNYLIFILLIN